VQASQCTTNSSTYVGHCSSIRCSRGGHAPGGCCWLRSRALVTTAAGLIVTPRSLVEIFVNKLCICSKGHPASQSSFYALIAGKNQHREETG